MSSREGSPIKHHPYHNGGTNGNFDPNGTSLVFTETRSVRRIHKNDPGGGGADLSQTRGIIDPRTGEILTLAEAIAKRILDVRTGQLIDPRTGRKMSIGEGVAAGLIEERLAQQLLGPGGVDIDNRPATLLEAIQREILEAERGGSFVEPTSGKKLSFEEAYNLGLVRREQVSPLLSCLLAAPPTFDEAVARGLIDPKSASYIDQSTGISISLSEAYERGYITIHTSTVSVRTPGVTLSDAIVQNLVEEYSGQLVDRRTGEKLTLDEAVDKGIVNPGVREVVDSATDVKLTLQNAMDSGIINAIQGRYEHRASGERLTFHEAHRRRLIVRPMTLKDCSDQGLISEDGKITSPTHRRKITILEAIAAGVLDPDTKSVNNVATGELLSLSHALALEIVTPDGKYKDTSSDKTLTVPEAVDRGLITSVAQKMIFDIDGIRDPDTSEFVSLNIALLRGLVDPNTGELVLDPSTGESMTLEEGVEKKLVQPQVLEMLNRKIGIRDDKGKELTVMEAVMKKRVDPRTGQILDGGHPISMDDALQNNMITPEGAAMLGSLLDITVTTSTITKTIKRYVTVTSSGVTNTEVTMSYGDALRRGLVDEAADTFKNPVTGEIVSIQEAAQLGLISRGPSRTPSPTKKVPSKEQSPVKEQQKRPSSSTEASPTKTRRGDSPRASSSEKQVFELPPDGWYLSEAIDQRLFDPVHGLFTIPGTDRLVSFEECVKLEIINPDSAQVVDPTNNRLISLMRSLEKHVVNSTGHYQDKNGKQGTMKEAIHNRQIILMERMEVDQEPNPTHRRSIKITRVSGKPDKLEVSELGDDSHFVEIHSASDASASEPADPVRVSPGVVFDPSSATVLLLPEKDNDTAATTNLVTAVLEGKIEPRLVKVKDAYTGKEMNINEAIRKGIVDKNTGEYKDSSGRKFSLSEAAKLGIVTVIGAPLVAGMAVAEGVKKVIKSTATIFDKSTGKDVPLEEALKQGMIDEKIYQEIKNGQSSPEKMIASRVETTKMSVIIQDPQTGEEIPVKEALERGLISPEQLDELCNKSVMHEKTIETQTLLIEDEDMEPSEAELTRERVTTEPKYSVTIGRARSFTQSPEREAKPVVLQKMRKKMVKPKDAVDSGLIDEKTANMLEKPDVFQGPKGEILTLSDALLQNKLDGSKGEIKDPQRGEKLNITEALERGILDSNSGQLLIPVAHSLTIPELVEQGLIDKDSGKIVHPETGTLLSLREAILCDIVDPRSILMDPITGKKTTLAEAIANQSVDANETVVVTREFPIDLITAVSDYNFFLPKVNSPDALPLPPVGMTFPLALQRGLIDAEKVEIIHPLTGERKPVEEAIKNDFIMALPHPVSPDSVEVTQALQCNLIDSQTGTFTNPKSGKEVPVSEAVEIGLLVVKPVPHHLSSFSGPVTAVTETVTSYHTITTKTIELKHGFILVNANEVQNARTGEIMSLEAARLKGIIHDESEVKKEFNTREIKMGFSDAVAQGFVDLKNGTFSDPERGTISIEEAISSGLLDTTPQESSPTKTRTNMNVIEAYDKIFDAKSQKFVDPRSGKSLNFEEAVAAGLIDKDSVVYDVASGEPLTTSEAIKRGVLDPKTGNMKDSSSGRNINIKEAAKLGLLAVVGAPILAGKAILDAVKSANLRQSEEPVTKEERRQSLKEKSPVITIKTSQAAPVYEKCSLSDAIKSKKVQPRTCTIHIPNEKPLTVEDALNCGLAMPQDIVELVSRQEVRLIEEVRDPPSPYNLDKNSFINEGLYDPESGTFFDPNSGEPIPFHELVADGVFNPDTIYIKDLRTDEFKPLKDVIGTLIDKNTGKIVDPKTGKRISFFDAVEMGLIIEQPVDMSESIESKTPALTLTELVNNGIYNPETGELTDPTTGEKISLTDAIMTGVIDPRSISIRNPENDDIIPLSEALKFGIIDLQRGVIINLETKREVELKFAFLNGLLVSKQRPLSIEAIVRKGLYNPDTGLVIDSLTKQSVPVEEAIKRGIVDVFSTECKNTKSGVYAPLEDSIEKNVIDSQKGIFNDLAAKKSMPLDKAVEKTLVRTVKNPVPLIEAIKLEIYSSNSGRVFDPASGEEVPLKEAIDSQYIDCSAARIKNDHSNKVIPVEQAVKIKLLDDELGVITYPHTMKLDSALEKGYIMSTKKPWSLQEALAHGCYDPQTGLMTIGETCTLDDAMRKGDINRGALTVKDPRSRDIITLGESIKVGIIDPKAGMATDPTNGADMHFYDALERGLIIPAKRKFSLPEAVFKGFYDPQSGKFISPETQEKLTTDKAIRGGLIDPATTLVKSHLTGELVTFVQAMKDGLVDAKAGTLKTGRFKRVDFQEAFDQGLLIEARVPMSLGEALAKGVFCERRARWLDPSSGEWLTLAEALECCLVDPESVHVRDTRSGFWKKISLAEAIDAGFINGDTAKLKDYERDVEVTLSQGFDLGLIVDSKAAISLQKAIHQGLYDDTCGKITDPNTGRKITLHEAIRRYIINPMLPCFWDKKSGRLLSLVETCRAGIIDRRAGSFHEPGSDIVVSISEAMELGLIVDIENAFGLYEAIKMGLYDNETKKFVHPSSGRKLTLDEACKEEFINPKQSIIKHANTGAYMKLPEAVDIGLINPEAGVYNMPDVKPSHAINLKEAQERQLIVTAKRPLSMAEAMSLGIFRPETGKFIDPDIGDHLDLNQSLLHGLIDGNTCALKDPTSGQLKSLNSAMEDGDIDVAKGRVIDPKTKKSYTFDAALARALLVTVERPITFQQAIRRGSIDFLKGTFRDPRTSRECTLEEAIKSELIDPESAVIKDPETGRFKTLKRALNEGLIDLNKRAMFDPQSGKAKTLTIIFDQGTIVFLREPLTFDTAVEQGHLDLATGRFTDPTSNEVLTLKEAVTAGLIDPDSALLKDTEKCKLVRLPEAYRKGLIDADKGNVINTATSHLCPLKMASETGLIVTPKRSISLIDALKYGLYHPKAGGKFTDPFTSKKLTLTEAIETGIIDPSLTMVKDAESGAVSSLPEAMSSKLIDAKLGEMVDNSSGRKIDLLQALDRGYLLAAEARVSQKSQINSECNSIKSIYISINHDRGIALLINCNANFSYISPLT